jgi:hypothetical protein
MRHYATVLALGLCGALGASAKTASAERVSGDVGVGHAWFDAPNSTTKNQGTSVSASLSFGGDVLPDLRLSGRLHVIVKGRDNATAFGPDVRYRRGMFMAAVALQLVRLHGPDTLDSRGDAIGVGAEMRIGVRAGPFTVVMSALPVHVIENETPDFTAQLRGALDIGISVGCELQ